MEKVDNIKSMWSQIDDKTDFLVKASKEFGRKVNTLRTHWFSKSNNYGMPDAEIDNVIKFMQNYLKAQNGVLIE